jgi:hypothetical protein
MKKPIKLKGIRESLANLKRIAKEHPRLIDHSKANWNEGDMQAMIDDKVMVYTIVEPIF